MPLDPRYARHLLLPEVGPAGQARLCAHTASVSDSPAGRIAAAYLERAGVRIMLQQFKPGGEETEERRGGKKDGVPLSLLASSLPPRLPSKKSDESEETLAGRSDLREAATWLSGAFAAVEEIKRALKVGEPGSLEGVQLTGPQDEDADR